MAAIGETHGLRVSETPRLDATGRAVVAALGDDPMGFQRLCGLAQIGKRLALATNREDYAALARAFGREPLSAAVRIAATVPDGANAHGYDSQQLVPAVERLGLAVLRAWAGTQGRGAADWIAMMLPRERDADTGAVNGERARAIVEAAAERWPLGEGTAAALAPRAARAAA